MKPLSVKLFRFGTFLNLLYNSYFACRLFKNIEVDMIYMRYRLYMPFFARILKKNKVIMEINGDDTTEYKLNSQLTHYYNKITRSLNFKYINAFTSVSNELDIREPWSKK